ncbi:phage head closure protein [Qipengyuania sp.]|uniref:phage head closure protein n=1 Tax=Qipengyuania sp. TaxID=2004515 RepID=UPI0035C817BE
MGLNIGAGELRHRITIRRSEEVQNAKGGFDTAWSDVATVRAKIEGLDGRESMMAQALQGISSYRITIRYRAGIRASDQIRLSDGSTLNITAPPADPDGRRRWLTIMADSGSVRSEI